MARKKAKVTSHALDVLARKATASRAPEAYKLKTRVAGWNLPSSPLPKKRKKR